MGIMITYHGYNNRYNNSVYNAHKNVGTHYTQQNVVLCSFETPQAKPLTLQGTGTALEEPKTQQGPGLQGVTPALNTHCL